MTSMKRISPFTIRLAGFAALALTSLCGLGIASARGANSPRGIVEARGPNAMIVVAGPIVFHAYSQFAGGLLYAAPVVSGTDRDCKMASASATPVQPDRVATFAVGEGQVACLSTTNRSIELLWHAVSQPVPALVIAKTSR
jgi:hypothetical protein